MFVLSFVACQKGYITDAPQEMTIEGWIENGKNPVVSLSQTMPADGRWHSIESFNELAVKDAKVTVNDGEKDYELTMVEVDGQAVYTTPMLVGEVGKTYTVKAETDKYSISGSSTIAQPAVITEARVEKVTDVEGDDRYKIVIRFNDDGRSRNYYKAFIKIEGEYDTYEPSLLGNKDDRKIDDECELSIYRSFTIPISEYQAYFRKGETVSVKLCTMDEIAFQYWDTFEELTIFSRNIFFPTTTKIKPTVEGGEGYWCAYGSSYITLTI